MRLTRKINYMITGMIVLFTALTLTSCNAQNNNTELADNNGIKWIDFEQAVALSEKSPKKIFIDVYTDWCGWCKKMDKTTFTEKEVVDYINTNYYAVKLNAETRDTIRFRDKEFKYIPDYKSNELAISLLGGKMGYPSYVLLDESFTMVTPPVQSYMTSDNLMPILTFFGDNIYKTKTWEEYTGQGK